MLASTLICSRSKPMEPGRLELLDWKMAEWTTKWTMELLKNGSITVFHSNTCDSTCRYIPTYSQPDLSLVLACLLKGSKDINSIISFNVSALCAASRLTWNSTGDWQNERDKRSKKTVWNDIACCTQNSILHSIAIFLSNNLTYPMDLWGNDYILYGFLMHW